MTASNFSVALNFVWAPGRDAPGDGYHVTPNDPGGGTFGGVTESSWASAVKRGVVTGTLRGASVRSLAKVMETDFWGSICDALPGGLDFAFFNGRMMSGSYPRIFQAALGFVADDVDGDVGAVSLARARTRQPETFLDAVCGAHYAYLKTLAGWSRFGIGWSLRLVAAQAAALAMLDARPMV